MSESSESQAERRSSPLVIQGVLLALFLAIAAVSLFTVLIPEIEDDGSEPDAAGETAVEAD